jgi:lipoprotein-anchoring transpeptidase ErfK/SrfK
MSVKYAGVTGILAALTISAAGAQTAPNAAGGLIIQDSPSSATAVAVATDPYRLAATSTPYVVRSPLVIEPKDYGYRVRARAATEAEAAAPPQAPRHVAPVYEAPPPPMRPKPEYRRPVQNEPAGVDQDQRVDVAFTRLMQNVPDDIESYYDLFMYVSKANQQPMGQRMFIFERDANGQVVPYAEWRVSTGREQWEERNGRRTFTATPEGVFRLDPDRFHVEYYSRTYDNAPMPYAMFFDMRTRGYPTGLAIHAAASASKIARLGRRDSGGCVRLSPKNAKELFYKIKNTTSGMVPVFAESRGSTDRWGKVARTADGNIRLTEGYKALLMIEDFDGRGVVGPVVAFTH